MSPREKPGATPIRLTLAVLVAAMAGCTERPFAPPGSAGRSDGCAGCHGSEERLRASRSAATSDPETRFLVAAGFFDTVHGAMACTRCHGGDGESRDRAVAHAGLRPDPSSGPDPVCASCHASIAADYAASPHARLLRLARGIARRERPGAETPSAAADTMLNAALADTRASCGDCHVARPRAAGGGLLAGHVFQRRPDAAAVCGACHGDRESAEFEGRAAGTQPDIHFTRGLLCTSCHDARRLHGSEPTAPDCFRCHVDIEHDGTRVEHAAHVGRLACEVCHALPYGNPYDWRLGRDGRSERGPTRTDFRIAFNADTDADHAWRYVVVRHVPVTPESFLAWDVRLDNFAGVPAWERTHPHNIQGVTEQDKMCETCHGRREIYLTTEYVDSLARSGCVPVEEVQADREITVDIFP